MGAYLAGRASRAIATGASSAGHSALRRDPPVGSGTSRPVAAPQPPERPSRTRAGCRQRDRGRGSAVRGAAGAGRPDNAATMGIRATARAGCREARVALTMRVWSRRRPATRATASTTRGARRRPSSRVRRRLHPASPIAVPTSAPTAPTIARVAEHDELDVAVGRSHRGSMPSARCRRRANAAKPAVATRLVNVSARTATANTMSAGRVGRRFPGCSRRFRRAGAAAARAAGLASKRAVAVREWRAVPGRPGRSCRSGSADPRPGRLRGRLRLPSCQTPPTCTP